MMQQRSYTRTSMEDYRAARMNEKRYKNNRVQEIHHLRDKIQNRKLYKKINRTQDYKPQ